MYKRIIDDYFEKAEQDGLDKNDYFRIKQYLTEADINIDKWEKYDFEQLLLRIYRNGLLHKYTRANVEYIQLNSQILPLVFANNTDHRPFRFYLDDGVYFLCHFHSENTPSLGVDNSKNIWHCWGCGMGSSSFSYVSQFLNIPFVNSIEVVAAIFNMNLPITLDGDSLEYVDKVKTSMISTEFADLREQLRVRLHKRGYENIPNYFSEQQRQIDNIRNGMYDSNFIYENPPQKVKFKRLESELY